MWDVNAHVFHNVDHGSEKRSRWSARMEIDEWVEIDGWYIAPNNKIIIELLKHIT